MSFGEIGTLTRGGFADGEVVRVDFDVPLDNAIIHMSSTNQGGNEFSLRIVSVDANGFNFVLEEWEDEDGPHPATETINWIAIEPGVHTLPDGRVIEAGLTTATDTASSVTLAGSHTGAPVVLTNVMSANDPDVVDSDPFNVTSSGFDVQLQEGSLSDGVNTGEDVGWIAISTGGDGTSGYASLHSGLGTGNSNFALGGTLTDGAVFGETQSMNNAEAGNVVISNATIDGNPGTISAKFDEETGNGESAHPNETLGLVGFEVGQLVCFTPDTLIETPYGPREIDSLCDGDLVLTADAGPQPIRYISKTVLSAQDLKMRPEFRPVRIRAGSLGEGLPAQDLVVSPQHRFLLSGWRAELLFGHQEVFAPAKGLLNDISICVENTVQPVTYIHLGFDDHNVIWANGSATESLHAGTISKDLMSCPAREELFAVFPELRADPKNWGPSARPVLKVSETKMLTQYV